MFFAPGQFIYAHGFHGGSSLLLGNADRVQVLNSPGDGFAVAITTLQNYPQKTTKTATKHLKIILKNNLEKLPCKTIFYCQGKKLP